MTNVGGQQDLLIRLARYETLTISEAAVLEFGVDNNLIGAFRQLFGAIVRHAKAPLVPSISGAVWNEVGLVGQCEDVFP